MAEKQKTQNQKEILDLNSVDLRQIQHHLNKVKYFNDAVFSKAKDDPQLSTDAINCSRVIDGLLIQVGKFIERAEQEELASRKSRSLGQIVDEYTSAVDYIEYLNNGMIALGAQETKDSSVVKLAAESLGYLMMCGIEAIRNQEKKN